MAPPARQMAVGYANSTPRQDGDRHRRDGFWLPELDHPDLPIVSSSSNRSFSQQRGRFGHFRIGPRTLLRRRRVVRFPYKPTCPFFVQKPHLSLIPFALAGG